MRGRLVSRIEDLERKLRHLVLVTTDEDYQKVQVGILETVRWVLGALLPTACGYPPGVRDRALAVLAVMDQIQARNGRPPLRVEVFLSLSTPPVPDETFDPMEAPTFQETGAILDAIKEDLEERHGIRFLGPKRQDPGAEADASL